MIQTTADLITEIEVKNFFHSERDKKQGSYMIDMEAWATALDLKRRMCTELILEKTFPDGMVHIDCPETSDIDIRIVKLKKVIQDDED